MSKDIPPTTTQVDFEKAGYVQPEQKHFGFYQLCPMCHGLKDIPNPYSGTATRIPCTICNGEGVMVRPEIRPGE